MKIKKNRLKSLTSIPFGGPIYICPEGRPVFFSNAAQLSTACQSLLTLGGRFFDWHGFSQAQIWSLHVHSCFWARAGSNHIGNFLFSVISGFSVFGRMETVDMAIWKFWIFRQNLKFQIFGPTSPCWGQNRCISNLYFWYLTVFWVSELVFCVS